MTEEVSGRKPVSPPRFKRLDALRGLAILSVIVFHAWIIRSFHGPWWMRFVTQGYQGVGLFYIISALTLVLSWQHRSNTDANPGKAFWARRFFRIAPLFYLMLLIAALVTTGDSTVVPPSMRGDIFTWPNLLAHITFVFGWFPWFQNSWIGVEWSIGVEMTFYALFPLIMRRIFPKASPWLFVLGGFGMSLIWPHLLQYFFGPWPKWARSYLFWSFPTQAVWFAAGIAIVKFDHSPTFRGWGMLWLLWALFLGWHNWPVLISNAVWVVPNYLLVWLSWHDHRDVAWLTHNRALQYVGTRSYSLYLTHWMILGMVSDLPWANPHNLTSFFLRLGAALSLSLVASELSYRFIEQPGIRLGKRVIDDMHWGRKPQEKTEWPSKKRALSYK
ncbi:MAG: acyltransferase [Firmicutes bacterium]|nr:acyltransferase [Bacillota bacterium]MCL5012482.1 acyltransferase [Bacillota bacterium]